MIIFVANKIDMKKLLVSFAIIFSLGLIISCSSADSDAASTEVVISEKKEVLAENKEAVDMKVEGMVCAMGCAKYIEDKVADLDGVVLSKVDFEKGLAHFEFDKTVTNPDDLEKFITDIHEGQYSAKIVSEEEIESMKAEEVSTEEVNESESKEIASISQSIQFSVPSILGYILHSLR
jgi:copper chaperone CopZ